MRLFSLAYDIPWGPMHYGDYAFGNSFEEALDNYKKTFPNARDYPDENGYGATYGLDFDRIKKDLGIAFRVDIKEEEFVKKYKII